MVVFISDPVTVKPFSLRTVSYTHLDVYKRQGEWYQIALGAGQSAFGWIHGDYLTAVTTVNDDPAFTSYLQSQGFPRSYWDSLRVLHAIYPNWTFEALHTGRTWAEVMQGENKKPINMVPMQKGDPYVDRTDVDINGNQIEWDTGWVKAHPDIVAYYMDPRNLLNDYHIFQFEDLRFHEGQHTLAGTGTNIRNTFMAVSYTHLDVYKRQVRRHNCFWRFSGRG